jgi:hypothetical protein
MFVQRGWTDALNFRDAPTAIIGWKREFPVIVLLIEKSRTCAGKWQYNVPDFRFAFLRE